MQIHEGIKDNESDYIQFSQLKKKINLLPPKKTPLLHLE